MKEVSADSLMHFANYYRIIETDLKKMSRYIEFTTANLDTYSTELTRLLLTASSEIDVILKIICRFYEPQAKLENINHYRPIILNNLETVPDEKVILPYYGLTITPWEDWKEDKNPDWWKSYNNVKHQRNRYYKESNLRNTLYSVSALLIFVTYYYKIVSSRVLRRDQSFKDTSRIFKPDIDFMRIEKDYYYSNFLI